LTFSNLSSIFSSNQPTGRPGQAAPHAMDIIAEGEEASRKYH
jgi:hypothetical protein